MDTSIQASDSKISVMQRVFLILTPALLLGLGGCASQRYTVVDPPNQQVTEFDTLEIRDFTSILNDEESIALAGEFADTLHSAVMKDRAANPDESIFEEVVRSTEKTERVLTLDGTIVSFEKGSQAKRYFIGFGSGKAYITIQSVFSDKATGEQVLKTNFDGELAGGLFGGSFDETVDAVVRAYIDYFDDYFEESGIE